MTKQEYAEALKDPRWQAKRQEILQRDEHRCLDCNRTPIGRDENDERVILHVHHCKYVFGNEPWEYANDTLRTLCEDCHAVRHEVEQECVDALRFLMAKSKRHELYTIKEDLEFRNRHTKMHGVPRNQQEWQEQHDLEEFFWQMKLQARQLMESLRVNR